MLKFGIAADQRGKEETIAHAIELLAARSTMECSICSISGGYWDEQDEISCVFLDMQDQNAAFGEAERLWRIEPSLMIVYVAHRAEDVFAALGMPFFHTVRSYDLEQDLSAVFRKLGRLRAPLSERIGFAKNGRTIMVSRKELIYIESAHHDICLHVGTEVLAITETLSQCEAKLRGMGFIRIYRSFLVNMYHIRCLERETALLDNGERLFVSRRRYPEARLMFEEYIRHLDFLR